jgi:hypothetical protein
MWLQSASSCAWGRQEQFLNTTLGSPGTPATTWTATLSCLTSGDYALVARAMDTSANLSSPATVAFGNGPAPTPSSPGYLTLLFGRTMWTAASGTS